MRAAEHLTKNQLESYPDRSLAPFEADEIEEHLVLCAACRDSLPAPTTEQFRTALLADEFERAENFTVAPSAAFFHRPLVWAAGALLMIGVLALSAMLLSRENLTSNKDMVRSSKNATDNLANKNIPPENVNRSDSAPVSENPIPFPSESLPPAANNSRSVETASEVPKSRLAAERKKNSSISAKASVSANSNGKNGKNRSTGRGDDNRMPPAAKRPVANEVARLEFPAELSRVIRPELLTLKGAGDEVDFDVIAPVGTFIKDDAPTFVWQSMRGAVRYELAVRSAKGAKTVFGATTSATACKAPEGVFDAYAGEVLQWSVTAYAADGSSRSTPSGSKPEALFIIIRREQSAVVEKQLSKNKNDALRRARILVRAGLLDDAEKTLESFSAAHPSEKNVRNLLRQIRARRRARQSNQPAAPITSKPAQ